MEIVLQVVPPVPPVDPAGIGPGIAIGGTFTSSTSTKAFSPMVYPEISWMKYQVSFIQMRSLNEKPNTSAGSMRRVSFTFLLNGS